MIRNEDLDLALLKMDSAVGLTFVNIMRAPSVGPSTIEAHVRVLGYPGVGGETLTITRGIVSGFDEHRNLKTDAEINPGNSGGAAFNDAGEVLGIPSSISAAGSGKIGFIISTDRIREWLTAIVKDVLLPVTGEQDVTFSSTELNYSSGNMDEGSEKPRLLVKFAAVETLLAQEEYPDAISHLEYILQDRPDSALAHSYYGKALLGLGRFSEAADRFGAALSYDPHHVSSLGNLGVALVNLLRYTEAVQSFDRIIRETDDPAQLWASYHNLARIYEGWSRPDLAGHYQNKADDLRSAAEARMAEYKSASAGSDVVSQITRAVVEAEIALGKDDFLRREALSDPQDVGDPEDIPNV